MLPLSPTDNLPNRASCDIKFYCEGSTCFSAHGITLAHLKNVNLAKFSKKMIRASRYCFGMCFRSMSVAFSAARPSFRNSVRIIIVIGSKKKMFRVYARFVIAMMQNVKSFWNLSLGQNPRHPLRCPRSISEVERPVSIGSNTVNPYPARPKFITNNRSIFIDLGPESFHGSVFQVATKIAI